MPSQDFRLQKLQKVWTFWESAGYAKKNTQKSNVISRRRQLEENIFQNINHNTKKDYHITLFVNNVPTNIRMKCNRGSLVTLIPQSVISTVSKEENLVPNYKDVNDWSYRTIKRSVQNRERDTSVIITKHKSKSATVCNDCMQRLGVELNSTTKSIYSNNMKLDQHKKEHL